MGDQKNWIQVSLDIRVMQAGYLKTLSNLENFKNPALGLAKFTDNVRVSPLPVSEWVMEKAVCVR